MRESRWPVNRAGFVIHSAMHESQPEAHCIMHTHTTTGMAVACLKDGLSPHNFYGAMLQGQVAYHDFEGITVEPGEKERLVRDIGDKRAVILRNHGLLAWGPSVPQAFLMLWTLQQRVRRADRGEPRPARSIRSRRRRFAQIGARIRPGREAHLRGRVRRAAAQAGFDRSKLQGVT